jgi:hypothetical protein
VIAVAVKPGHAPSGLTAGSRVSVLVLPSLGQAGTVGGGGSAAAVVQAAATVVSVEQAGDQSGTSVVSLLLAAGDATRVASTTGDASLVQLGAGG